MSELTGKYRSNRAYYLIFFINILIIALSSVLDNNFLTYKSYYLFGVQLLTFIPYILYKVGYAKNIFLPSVFTLIYFLISQSLGSYLVPLGYGWYSGFGETVTTIKDYNIIMPYLLICNLALFMLSIHEIKRLHYLYVPKLIKKNAAIFIITSFLSVGAFWVVSYLDVFQAFSFQLAIMICHLTSKHVRHSKGRFLFYLLYLLILLQFSFSNKRELAMALFAIAFLECYGKNYKLNLNFKSSFICVSFIFLFLAMVLAASILRGYGGFEPKSFFHAILLIPSYVSSDVFIDGITDNLELNYSYGTSVTAMDYVITQKMDYLYGASLIKPLFLPIPREIWETKPESSMLIFTREFSYVWWQNGGSLPIMLAADMFINFHFFGIFIFICIVYFLNKAFSLFKLGHTSSFKMHGYFFLFITTLMFVRGSGLDQYLLYFIFAAPVFFIFEIFQHPRKVKKK